MTRILVVDDDGDLRSLLELMLRRAGYEVDTATDGDTGLSAYRQAPAQLVITDMFMPGRGGMGFVRDLRRDYPDARVIAISGGFKPAQNADLRAEGVSGVTAMLDKPFLPDQLLRAVEAALAA
jgi:CheY-like chemotaxis protein